MIRSAFHSSVYALAAWVSLTLMGPFAHVQAKEWEQAAERAPIRTSYLKQVAAQAEPGAKVIGRGANAWRFVVRHPERLNEPYRRASYYVKLPDGLRLDNGDFAVVGVTDAQGRTDIIRVQAESAPEDWVVLPAWGHGPGGRVFRYSSGHDDGVPDMPYMLETDSGPIYCGTSLPTGHTAYLQALQSQGVIHRNVADQANCQAFQKVLNSVLKAPNLELRLAGLRRLIVDVKWLEYQELLREKLRVIILREGSQTDIERYVQDRVYKEWGISKAEQASLLNGIAYELMTMNPPRLPTLTNQLIDQSLTLNANAYNIDTKGWALHLMGRYSEALEMYARALADFQTMCKPDKQLPYLETLAHQAETLWVVGRRDEAINLWADIARNAARDDIGDSWRNSLKHWQDAKDDIQSRLQTLNDQGVPVVPSCAEMRDQQSERTP